MNKFHVENEDTTWYEVAEYQGNLYVRERRPNDNTLYMDFIHDSFDTKEEANAYVEKWAPLVEEAYIEDFYYNQ